MVVKHDCSRDDVPWENRAVSNPIADRVRAYVAERDAEIRLGDPDAETFTVRKLSLLCGWDGSHLGTVLRRLDAGKDVRRATLETIATQMGRPEAWLTTGQMPPGFRLADAPGWDQSAAEARERFKVPAEAVDAIGQTYVPKAPRHLDGQAIAILARTLDDMTRDGQ